MLKPNSRMCASNFKAICLKSQSNSTRADFDGDFFGIGVEGILDKFLHDAGGAFDHFAGGDLVGDLLGEKFDPVHVETILRFNGHFANGSEKQKIALRCGSLRTQMRPP